jgi:hypothetical protein
MAKNNFPRTKARIACALSLAALFAFDAGGDGARAGFLEELFGLGAPQQAAQVPQPSGKSDRGRRAGRGSRIQSSLSYMPKARRHVAKNAGEKVAGVPNGKKGFCYADTAQTVDPAQSDAILHDSTLRAGDTIVTDEGVRVFHGGGTCPHKDSDFLALAETRDISSLKRNSLVAIENAMKTRIAVGQSRSLLFTARDSQPR